MKELMFEPITTSVLPIGEYTCYVKVGGKNVFWLYMSEEKEFENSFAMFIQSSNALNLLNKIKNDNRVIIPQDLIKEIDRVLYLANKSIPYPGSQKDDNPEYIENIMND